MFLKPPHLIFLSFVWQSLHLIQHHFTHPRPVWQCHNNDSKKLLLYQARKQSKNTKKNGGASRKIPKDCNRVSNAPAYFTCAAGFEFEAYYSLYLRCHHHNSYHTHCASPHNPHHHHHHHHIIRTKCASEAPCHGFSRHVTAAPEAAELTFV